MDISLENDIYNYINYAKYFQKISTKMHGVRRFELHPHQVRFIKFWESINGPVRIIVLKGRQMGYSTTTAGKISHLLCTNPDFKAIVMADKKTRTDEIASIYRMFLTELPEGVRPMISVDNSERIVLSNPKDDTSNPGLNSSILFETGNDENAGRSGTRRAAHMSEVAFMRYAAQIDESLGNSIPLLDGTVIIKESTANGRAGVGKNFFDLYQAAKRGDSIYKPFFVPWFEMPDYRITPEYGFNTTKVERELMRQYELDEAQINWRRVKISSYTNSDDNAYLTPDERFKQDFPCSDTEAFLSTGQPIFDAETLNKLSNRLNNSRPVDIKDRLDINSHILKQYWDGLKIFTPPRDNMDYFIGADVSEGLAQGDASSVFILDRNWSQVGRWHGKIDPDLFGHLLMALGELYNNAAVCCEKNNMGLTTILTLRNEGYPRIYKEIIEDKITKVKKERLGWVTTKQSKMRMLNLLVKRVRDSEINILDTSLVAEMGQVAREENGSVNLNGMDRVVAACLACIAREQFTATNTAIKPKLSAEFYDKRAHEALKPKKEKVDFFG